MNKPKYSSKEVFAVGTIHESNQCGKFKVVSYESPAKITIEFVDTGYQATTQASALKYGSVKDKLSPTFLGVACFGDGEFTIGKNGNAITAYKKWEGLLAMCYNVESSFYAFKGAKGIKVCNEWLNFQNFARWLYERNRAGAKYKVVKEKGAMVYSPDTCELVVLG